MSAARKLAPLPEPAKPHRELSDDAVEHQARALAKYAERGGAVSRWLDSKDLLPADREAVLRAWARMAD